MKILKNGLMTGLLIQLAIGPVFFFVIHLSLQKTILDGLVAVMAVTLVDYFYIALAIVGIGKLLEKKNINKILGIVSSVILIIFGSAIIKSIAGVNMETVIDINSPDLFTSFAATFFLAISNPMIIVWNTSILTAKAVEYNYSKKELLIFGLSIGLATPIVFGVSVMILYALKETVPIALIQTLNVLVGGLLILYGGIRLVKALRGGT